MNSIFISFTRDLLPISKEGGIFKSNTLERTDSAKKEAMGENILPWPELLFMNKINLFY